jgi:hypothetical protein
LGGACVGHRRQRLAALKVLLGGVSLAAVWNTGVTPGGALAARSDPPFSLYPFVFDPHLQRLSVFFHVGFEVVVRELGLHHRAAR